MKGNTITMMRKTMRFAALIMFLFPMFGLAHHAYAQDATCTIELSSLAAEVITTQAVASGGDIPAGIAGVTSLRDQIRAIREACEAAGVQAVAVLDGRYVAPNASFRTEYPIDWIIGNFTPAPSGGGIVFGNSQGAITSVSSRNPILNPGQQAIILTVTTAEAYGIVIDEAAPLTSLITQFAAQAVAMYDRSEPVVDEEAGFARLAFAPPEPVEGIEIAQVQGEVMISRLPEGRYAFVIALTLPGEYPALQPIAEALTRSVN